MKSECSGNFRQCVKCVCAIFVQTHNGIYPNGPKDKKTAIAVSSLKPHFVGGDVSEQTAGNHTL